jgi:hypothetical protein
MKDRIRLRRAALIMTILPITGTKCPVSQTHSPHVSFKQSSRQKFGDFFKVARYATGYAD